MTYVAEMEQQARKVTAVRLTTAELAVIKRAAASEGLSLSTWIRVIAVKAAKKVVGTKSGT